MRPAEVLRLVWACGAAAGLVRACSDHGAPPREWTQEELDDLERKWGVDVSPFHAQLPLHNCQPPLSLILVVMYYYAPPFNCEGGKGGRRRPVR